MLPLFLIFFHILSVWGDQQDFFTHMPQPVGETGGGFANAIVGSLILLVLACVVGLPSGFSAVFISRVQRQQGGGGGAVRLRLAQRNSLDRRQHVRLRSWSGP
jgi:phosphate transport system permease protein